jgi:ABC-type sulfate/molybdate transport systems ATPase subunit
MKLDEAPMARSGVKDPSGAPSQETSAEGLHAAFELHRGGFHLRAAFAAPSGITALLGPSGAGKSLTLQAIAGLARVSRGVISLNGVALVDTTRSIVTPARARRIGYVPQSYALFPHLSVAQNVAYGLPPEQGGYSYRWQSWFSSTRRQRRADRVAELLAVVRLPGFEDRRPAQLSGGEAQRVALARALAAQPAALLLDEPLSALDAPTREAIRDDLRTIIATSGIPTLLVTHDLAEARALADRLVALCAGQVVAEGPLGATLASPPTTTAARLFGWENILAAQSIQRLEAGATRVTLADGQTLVLPEALAPTPGKRLALALRTERLELRASAHAEKVFSVQKELEVYGRVKRATDAGAYYRVRVALGGQEANAEDACLTVLCSPREWLALGIESGAPVTIVIPPDAVRLVIDDLGEPTNTTFPPSY